MYRRTDLRFSRLKRWTVPRQPVNIADPSCLYPSGTRSLPTSLEGPAVIGELPERRPEKATLSTRTGLKHALKPGWTAVARSIFSVNQPTPCGPTFRGLHAEREPTEPGGVWRSSCASRIGVFSSPSQTERRLLQRRHANVAHLTLVLIDLGAGTIDFVSRHVFMSL